MIVTALYSPQSQTRPRQIHQAETPQNFFFCLAVSKQQVEAKDFRIQAPTDELLG